MSDSPFIKEIPVCPSCKIRIPEFISFSKGNEEKDEETSNEIIITYSCECQPKKQRKNLTEFLSLMHLEPQTKNELNGKKCSLHQDSPCQSFCLFCNNYMCDKCMVQHLINKPTHKLSYKNIYYLPLCSVHNLKNKFFCEECNKNICKECSKLSEHNGHNVITLKNNWKKNLKKIEIISSIELHELCTKKSTKFTKFCDLKIEQLDKQINAVNEIKNNIINIKKDIQKKCVNMENLIKVIYQNVENCIKYPNVNLIKSLVNINEKLNNVNDKLPTLSNFNYNDNCNELTKKLNEIAEEKVFLISFKNNKNDKYKHWINDVASKFIKSGKTFESLSCFKKKEENIFLFSSNKNPLSYSSNTNNNNPFLTAKPSTKQTNIFGISNNNENVKLNLFSSPFQENNNKSLFGCTSKNQNNTLGLFQCNLQFDNSNKINDMSNNSSFLNPFSFFSNDKEKLNKVEEEKKKEKNSFFFLTILKSQMIKR